MGLEISWYLRLGRQDVLEALVRTAAAPQVRSNFGPDMGYDMWMEERGENTLFRFTRQKKPGADAAGA